MLLALIQELQKADFTGFLLAPSPQALKLPFGKPWKTMTLPWIPQNYLSRRLQTSSLSIPLRPLAFGSAQLLLAMAPISLLLLVPEFLLW